MFLMIKIVWWRESTIRATEHLSNVVSINFVVACVAALRGKEEGEVRGRERERVVEE